MAALAASIIQKLFATSLSCFGVGERDLFASLDNMGCLNRVWYGAPNPEMVHVARFGHTKRLCMDNGPRGAL